MARAQEPVEVRIKLATTGQYILLANLGTKSTETGADTSSVPGATVANPTSGQGVIEFAVGNRLVSFACALMYAAAPAGADSILLADENNDFLSDENNDFILAEG
jgi:hypothetical protein